MKFINTVLALCLSAVAFAKCCEKKCPQGTEKYYSIDTKFDRCGECCMAPEMYAMFKKYEAGLEKAWWDHACLSFGYTVYENTETHGSPQMSMTLDKYKRPN